MDLETSDVEDVLLGSDGSSLLAFPFPVAMVVPPPPPPLPVAETRMPVGVAAALPWLSVSLNIEAVAASTK